jgi:hypothetical protein
MLHHWIGVFELFVMRVLDCGVGKGDDGDGDGGCHCARSVVVMMLRHESMVVVKRSIDMIMSSSLLPCRVLIGVSGPARGTCPQSYSVLGFD